MIRQNKFETLEKNQEETPEQKAVSDGLKNIAEHFQNQKIKPTKKSSEKGLTTSRRDFVKNGLAFLGMTAIPENSAASEGENERKSRLQEELNFLNCPGRHTKDSVIVASREEELKLLEKEIDIHHELIDFEGAVYRPENIRLIPLEKKDEAEIIAKRKFEEYIKKYQKHGATINNVVQWVTTGLPGAGSNKTHIYDTENENNTWTVHAAIENEGLVGENTYVPKYIIAFHEVMHVEETPKGAPAPLKNPGTPAFRENNGSELLTTIKTILLEDEIYKEIFGLNLEEEIDYKKNINWQGRKIGIGALANFYRALEKNYGTIGKAVASNESLDLIINSK